VVAAIPDPNPAVRGRGLQLLRRGGVLVETGVLAADAELLNRRFLVAMRERRPFVLLKAAVTLDGRIATASGDSRWITSDAARRAARRLRRLHDAVAVGIGTVLADDPRLLPEPALQRVFHRIVFDSRLRLPPRSRLVRTARRSPVWVLCHDPSPLRARRLEKAGVRVLAGPARRGQVSLDWALTALRAEGITSLMVEGGSEVLGSFLAERVLDEVALFRAPRLLGGRGSLSAFGGPDPRRVGDALQMRPIEDVQTAAPGIEPGLVELWYPVRRGR
jgi:diaminohydroxyphosphoribosylaminopyrimidine deaminase/5-amino-6-(5-phosphoribosylamino)uracil reductase